MKHGFIGFGNVARAIYAGLQDEQNSTFVYVAKHDEQEQKYCETHYPSLRQVATVRAVVEVSTIIWLCVKPQQLAEAMQDLQGVSFDDKTIVSPVAGKSIDTIEHYVGARASIVRIMPNLAIACKKSVTAFAVRRPSAVSQSIKNSLAHVGQVVEIDEKHFDLFTSVFGSGPAFLLRVLEVFKIKMSELDIDKKRTDELALALLDGTSSYLQANYDKKTIAELISAITSAGGTTEAGLRYFDTHNLAAQLDTVLQVAAERAKELGSHK